MQTKGKLGLFSIVMLGLSAIIGSGWLFGAWEASRVAGPAAILSWLIGAVVVCMIALNYVELGTMFPETGGMSRYAQYTHGSLLGFISAWSNWISLITLIPIEAVAAVQYMSSWPWSWARWTRVLITHNQISDQGLLVVLLFILIFTLLNYWSLSILTRFTNLVAVFKVAVPLLTVIFLLLAGFHCGNELGEKIGGFIPYGSAAIFVATTSSGIIFSYNAFQVVINMGHEIKYPKRDIPLGIIISLVVSIVIYVLLQFTYTGTVSPTAVAKFGWRGISLQSPFADLAAILGIYWLNVIIYADAFVSPFGTGVSFVAQTSRALAAMANGRHIPELLGKINSKWNIPRVAMTVDLVLSFILATLFRSWSALASAISAAALISYLTGPVTVITLRKVAPNFKRPIQIPGLKWIAPLAFVLASLAIYWAMWPTTIEVIIFISLGLPFYFYYEWRAQWRYTESAIRSSLWLISYLIFISLISKFGSRHFGGDNLIGYPWDFGIVILISLFFYSWGIHSFVRTKDFQIARYLNRHIHL